MEAPTTGAPKAISFLTRSSVCSRKPKVSLSARAVSSATTRTGSKSEFQCEAADFANVAGNGVFHFQSPCAFWTFAKDGGQGWRARRIVGLLQLLGPATFMIVEGNGRQGECSRRFHSDEKL